MNSEIFLSKLVNNQDCKNVFDELREETIPLIIWGGGSMSVSVRRLLQKEKIAISACWIDNCGTNESIDGIPILNIADIQQKYEKINVIFGHSKYELSDEICKKYSFIKKCYCLVNVCYGQWKRISHDFVKDHAIEYVTSYNLLGDEKSRECFISYLNCKLSEDFRYLLKSCEEKATYFSNPFFKLDNNEIYVDIGAYSGDTITEFLNTTNGNYSNIFAIEPEKESFKELNNFVQESKLENVTLFECGCWDENTTLKFEENEESSSIGSEGTQELEVYKLDSLLENQKVTLIKINFLSGVFETLKGAERILQNQKPKLVVTVGFDEWGIIRIPQIIKEINVNYKIYLRFASAMPARLILFAC